MDRLQDLIKAIETRHLSGAAITPGPTLVYLTGLHFHLSERPTLLLASGGSKPVFLLPELELAKLQSWRERFHLITFPDNPDAYEAAYHRAGIVSGLEGQTIGVEPTRMRFLESALLQKAIPGVKLADLSGAVAEMRMRKSEEELASMRKAVTIAQDALDSLLPSVHAGQTERAIAGKLMLSLYDHGSGIELPFSPIVSSGPNSANPHASPSDRKLVPGDLLVIDWGASWNGLFSDLTRTFAVGEVSGEFKQIHSLVLKANQAGRDAVRGGASAGSVDRAARTVIETGGYGTYFTHRTGHGLGLEGHEPPYIYQENKLILTPGMTFTVEPGIYLPDRGGVRIEDNIVVTDEGCECLSTMTRELRVIS